MKNGPKNTSRYYNIYANNAQSYLNSVKAMKTSGHSHMSTGRRMNFKVPGMKMGVHMNRNRGMRGMG